MSQIDATTHRANLPTSEHVLEHGIVDLYARRMRLVQSAQSVEQQDALERMVVTRPFGRAFTAQPSYPPEPDAAAPAPAGALTGLRRRLADAAAPARKLAPS